MPAVELTYLADKIHIHRWPQDSPAWNDSVSKSLDERINQNKGQKQVSIREKTVRIENFEFHTLQKIGVSVPFFKHECTIIFEAKFDGLSAHVHITIKSKDYVSIFNRLVSWRDGILHV